MTIDQIINWMMGLNVLVLSVTGFFLAIGFLFLVTAIYSLIYDKAFRKKYFLKLGTIFFILLVSAIGIFYLYIKHGTLIL
jgi:Ni,Fe-hydrogenase I cytochrome b subunit